MTRPGHEHCDATEGILLDITPLVVDGKKLVTLYDKDLTEGVNLLIGTYTVFVFSPGFSSIFFSLTTFNYGFVQSQSNENVNYHCSLRHVYCRNVVIVSICFFFSFFLCNTVVSDLWGPQCVRLKVTVKSDNCGENAQCNGKGVCFSNASMVSWIIIWSWTKYWGFAQ